MSNSSKKIIGGIILLVVILSGVGYFVLLPQYEKDYAARVAAVIDALPGNVTAKSINVGYLEKKVVITGLTGTLEHHDAFALDIKGAEEIVITGINLDAETKPGVAPLFDSLRITGLKADFVSKPARQEGESLRLSYSVGSLSLKGVKGDRAALAGSMSAFASDGTPADHKEAVRAFVAGISTIQVEEGAVTDYETVMNLFAPGQEKIRASLQHAEYKNFSLFSYGPIKATGGKIDLGILGSITYDSYSIESMKFPDFLTLALTGQSEEEERENFLALLSTQPVSVEGLVFRNCIFKQPEGKDEIKIAEGAVTLQIGEEKLVWRHAIQGLMISPAYVFEDERQAQVYDRPFELSSKLDLDVTLKGSPGIVMDSQVVEKNLGSSAITAELPLRSKGEGIQSLFEYSTTALLKAGTVTLEDKGIVDLYAMAQISLADPSEMPSPEYSPASYRMSLMKELHALAQNAPTPDMKEVVEGLSQLAGGPGRLRISVNLEEPLDIIDIIGSRVPLNAIVEYTPAAE